MADLGNHGAECRLEASYGEVCEFRHKCVVIKLGAERVERAGTLYEAARHAWKEKLGRASMADFVLAAVDGVVAGVFLVEFWYRCTNVNALKYGGAVMVDRIAFVGHPADGDDAAVYIGKRLPEHCANSRKQVWYTYDKQGNDMPSLQ